MRTSIKMSTSERKNLFSRTENVRPSDRIHLV